MQVQAAADQIESWEHQQVCRWPIVLNRCQKREGRQTKTRPRGVSKTQVEKGVKQEQRSQKSDGITRRNRRATKETRRNEWKETRMYTTTRRQRG